MSKDKALQIISCGPGLSAINSKYGRSSEWVRDIVKNRISDIDIVNIYEGDLPSCNTGDVWVITGSRYSVYDNFYFWNFDDIFCREKCLIGNTQKSFYFDDNHLSIEGAKLIEDHLLEIFKTFDPHST